MTDPRIETTERTGYAKPEPEPRDCYMVLCVTGEAADLSEFRSSIQDAIGLTGYTMQVEELEYND